MDKETFKKEIIDKTRVNHTASLFSTIETTRGQQLARLFLKKDKVDTYDALIAAYLAASGMLGIHELDTLHGIDQELYPHLLDLNEKLMLVQRLLAGAKKIELGKLREFTQYNL